MTIDDIHEFLDREFPQVAGRIRVESLHGRSGRVRYLTDNSDLRPGGTVSGPAMFLLADVAAYIVILASVGPKALAVTVNCSMDFMRKPRPGDLIADAQLLKLGGRLAFCELRVFSDGENEPVARAGIIYAIPE